MFLEDVNECFSVRIRRAAVSRMNNDPADIGLRGKAFGSWAACSRPTDDWWPAEERKHVQLWGKWFTEAVDSCHSLENIKVMVGSIFQITEHSHDTEMFFLMAQSHWTHRSCKIRREKIRKYLFSSKVFMNWSHDVMNTDMLATICPDERLNSLEPFVSSNISALILYFTLNKRYIYSSTVLLHRWNIGLFTSLHLFSSCDKH